MRNTHGHTCIEPSNMNGTFHDGKKSLKSHFEEYTQRKMDQRIQRKKPHLLVSPPEASITFYPGQLLRNECKVTQLEHVHAPVVHKFTLSTRCDQIVQEMHRYLFKSGGLEYENNWTNVGVKYGLATMQGAIILDSYTLGQTPMILNKMRQKNFIVYRDESQVPELQDDHYESNVRDTNHISMRTIRNNLERVTVRKS